ncbi:MAG: phosphatidylserine decarboxylase family protein [Desulfobulbus sp.]|jgi:phosphatidylserine decarboxylase
MQKPSIPVTPEGAPFIALCALATLTFSLLGLIAPALVCLVLTAFVTWFFRDPVRVLPAETGVVVCPADGKIIGIEALEHAPLLQGKARKVAIFMNVFNVHVNRTPLAGTVETVLWSPGRFYSADTDKATLHNEQCALTLRTPEGWRYAMVQIAGLIARRIVCWAEPGDRLAAGERFGMIRMGSRVDLYLPPEAEILVHVGQKVRAGESVIAALPERETRPDT